MIQALLVSGLVLSAPPPSAAWRVGIATLHGPHAQPALTAILDSLSKVPALEVTHLPPGTAACGDGACDLILRGEVIRRGSAVHLTAHAGASRKPVDTFILPLQKSGPPLRKAASTRLAAWVTRTAALVRPAPADTALAAEAPPPTPSSSAAPSPVAAEPPATARAEAMPPPALAPDPVASSTSRRSDNSQTVSAVVNRPESTTSRPFLELTVGGGTLARHLVYTDDLFGALNNYALNAAPLFAGSVEFYPLSHLGLIGSIEHSVGVTSVSSGGLSLATNEGLYEGGLRGRFFLGASEVGVSAQYGAQRFDFTQGAAAAPLPDYDYSFVQGAVDGRIALGDRVALLARAGYLQVLTNSLKANGFFPRAAAGGLDAAFGPVVALSSLLELRLLGEYRRFFFSMNPLPGDAHVAGGALDQYFTVMLEGAVRFR